MDSKYHYLEKALDGTRDAIYQHLIYCMNTAGVVIVKYNGGTIRMYPGGECETLRLRENGEIIGATDRYRIDIFDAREMLDLIAELEEGNYTIPAPEDLYKLRKLTPSEEAALAAGRIEAAALVLARRDGAVMGYIIPEHCEEVQHMLLKVKQHDAGPEPAIPPYSIKDIHPSIPREAENVFRKGDPMRLYRTIQGEHIHIGYLFREHKHEINKFNAG